jgi:hypothetical protein
MKPFDYYSKPQTLYPNKSDYITFYVYDRGACIYSESALSNTKSALKEDYPNAVIQEVLDEEGYKAHQLQYTDEKPKRQKAFDLAWEKGHANGLEEVYNEFYDLVELIQD